MKKITDLTEERYRTVHERDLSGRLQKGRIKVKAKRTVRTITTGPRIGHFIIDYLCLQVVAVAVQVLATLAFWDVPPSRWTVAFQLLAGLLVLLIIPALYVYCEFRWQRTPGKIVTKTLVVDEFGNRPDLKTIILRTMIRVVPFEPFSCFGDPHSRGWHDRWSNTFVVPDAELRELKRLQAEQS